MATVTVPGGPSSPPLTYTFSSGAGLSVAQQIANALGAANLAGTLSVTSAASVSGSVAIPTVSSGLSDLVVTTVAGATTVTGTGVLTTNNAGPSTITATGGSTVIGGSGGGSFTATGAASQIGLLGGNNTITANGAGDTVGGGTGSNLFVVTGTGDFVQSQGSDTVSSSGSGNLIVDSSDGTKPFIVNESGIGDTILGGANPTTVTASTSTRVYAGSGSLFVRRWWSGDHRDDPGRNRHGVHDCRSRRYRVRRQYGHQCDREQRDWVSDDLWRLGRGDQSDRKQR